MIILIYCIGDLHGRYDLFQEALKKIDFNSKVDKIYLLGDLIDRGKESVEILNYCIKHKDSVYAVKGNHEEYFISNIKFWDEVMYDDNMKNLILDLVKCYSRKLYNLIGSYIEKHFNYCTDLEEIRTLKKVKEWEKVSSKRKNILDLLSVILKEYNYDTNRYNELIRRLNILLDIFKSKKFIIQILESDIKQYELIKEYIINMPEEYEIEVNGKIFILRHNGYRNNLQYKLFVHFADMNIENKILLYGHDPLEKVRADLTSNTMLNLKFDCHGFDLDTNEILSYIDSRNNRYYNLDMVESNCLGILRLNDMEEFYVLIIPPKARREYILTTSSVNERKKGYRILLDDEKELSFVSYRNYCMEYFIFYKKENLTNIYYTRVDYFGIQYFNSFKGIIKLEEKKYSIEEIIKFVDIDFKSKINEEKVILSEKLIRNLLN